MAAAIIHFASSIRICGHYFAKRDEQTEESLSNVPPKAF